MIVTQTKKGGLMRISKKLGGYFCLSSVFFLGSIGHAKPEEGRGFFMPGVGIMNFSALNTKLNDLDYSGKISNVVPLIGGGGYGVLSNNIILGGHGYLMKARPISSETHVASLVGGAGFFDIGYRFKFQDLNVYPLLGIGGGGMGLHVDPKDTEFDDHLKGTTKKFSTKTGLHGAMINLSLGVDKFLFPETLSSSQEREIGHSLGLRMGYVHSFNKTKGWKKGETANVLNGTAQSLSHFYVTLTIGGGHRQKGTSPTPVAVKTEGEATQN